MFWARPPRPTDSVSFTFSTLSALSYFHSALLPCLPAFPSAIPTSYTHTTYIHIYITYTNYTHGTQARDEASRSNSSLFSSPIPYPSTTPLYPIVRTQTHFYSGFYIPIPRLTKNSIEEPYSAPFLSHAVDSEPKTCFLCQPNK